MIAAVDNFITLLLADGALVQFRARGLYRPTLILAIVGSTLIAIINTVPDVWGEWSNYVQWADWAALALMSVDYLLRLRLSWLVGQTGARGQTPLKALSKYALGPYGIFDFLAVVPLILELIFLPLSQDMRTVLGLLSFLKLARYSPALEILGTVVIEEIKPLSSALFIVALLAIVSATAMYFVERHMATHFTNLPDALWWAIITLTTVGYGDVVPETAPGRVLNSVVAVLGLCMFALPASILATGFSEETRRRSLMNTWNLVSKVPMFATLHAGQIAEIAALLRPVRIAKGDVVVHEGDAGDSMFFIVSGHLEARTTHGIFTLNPGDFFGEIALVERTPRTATVVTTCRSQLLVLQVLDFQRFVGRYPELLEEIRKIAQSRLKK